MENPDTIAAVEERVRAAAAALSEEAATHAAPAAAAAPMEFAVLPAPPAAVSVGDAFEAHQIQVLTGSAPPV